MAAAKADYKKDGVRYFQSLIDDRVSMRDLNTWDIALIYNDTAFHWQAALTAVVNHYDADNYKTKLYVTSYYGQKYLGWADQACRRTGAHLGVQPTEGDFPLRVTEITKRQRTS